MVSLGCPKNLTDSEAMAGTLAAAGYELTDDERQADIALINTCAFLSAAVRESEAEIGRFLALKKTGSIKAVIAAGCLGERLKDELLRRFPGLDAVVGVNALDKVAEALRGKKTVIPRLTGKFRLPVHKVRLTAPHSAYLKIADGCDNRCAYCLIPDLRGPFRSKPMQAVIEEAGNLVSSGAKEISLIAQDTTSYGADLYGKPRLFELLKGLVGIKGLLWLRLMYVYPEKLTGDILALMRERGSICRYVDMPLQHISDNVLKKMNRRSSERSIRSKIAELRLAMPDIAIRTNFIVGFPGETGEDFEKLEKFVRETRFDNLGVFKYSPEKGTPAASAAAQVPQEVKDARFKRLVAAQSLAVDNLNAGLKGKTLSVLMDSAFFGRTYRDAPDIDGRVEIIKGAARAKPDLKAGDFVSVKITGASGYTRRGTVIPTT